MKQIIAMAIATGLVYVLISLIAGHWHPFIWHWSLRIITALWLVATWKEIMANKFGKY